MVTWSARDLPEPPPLCGVENVEGTTISRARSTGRSIVVITLALCAAAPALAVEFHRFTVTDLGTLGGRYSVAYGINRRGQVVGESRTGAVDEFGSPISHAFLWLPAPDYGLPAGMNDLGVIDGERSSASDINDIGQVVGWSDAGVDAFGPVSHAFRWERGVFTDLGTLSGAGEIPIPLCCGTSDAVAINESGEVVGYEHVGYGGTPFVWLPSAAYGLDAGINTLIGGALASADDINNDGQIVGKRPSSDVYPEGHAYVWLPAPNHGLPAGLNILTSSLPEGSGASAINDRGQVVGTAAIREDPIYMVIEHGFLWENGELMDLGTLGGDHSAAVDINESGQIIGRSFTLSGERPFLWQDGAMIDLNELIAPDSGWELAEVHAINDAGQIVGWGEFNGDAHAFLLTPIVPIPAVSTWGVVVSILALLTVGVVVFGRTPIRAR